MTEWTAADSYNLDRTIRAAYPHRRPLEYDPAIAALIAEPQKRGGGRPSSIGTCIICAQDMWRSRKPKPAGQRIARHHGKGLCSACYQRTRTTDEQATG